MCTSINVVGQNVGELGVITSVAELASFLGSREAIVWHDGDTPSDEREAVFGNCCLCPVDIPCTLINHGFRVWKDYDGDPMEYQCEPAPLSSRGEG